MTRSFVPAFIVCTAFFAAGVFHVWQRVEGIQLGYRLGEVTAEHQALLRHNEQLRLEVATLKAPSRIEALARKHFDMAPPRPDQMTVIPSGRKTVPRFEPELEVLTAKPDQPIDYLSRIDSGMRKNEEPRG